MQEVFGFLDEDVAAYVGDGVGERELLGADLDTVLRESALLHTAIAGEGAEAFFLEDFAGGVVVEELDLCDGGRADKACLLSELRTNLHAAGAGNAVGEGIADFLLLREDTRAGAEVVGAIDGNPGLNGLEVLEEDGAIDLKIPNERKLGERLDADGLLEILDER